MHSLFVYCYTQKSAKSRKKRMNERIKEVREHLGLTQKELAGKLGIAFRSLQNYESTSRKIPSDMIKELYTQFSVNPVWLLTGEGSMYGSPGTIPQTEEEPIDEIEVFLELSERVEGWIQKGLVKPQAKKAMVRELYELVSVRRKKKGKGSRQEPGDINVTKSSGVLNLGDNNKIVNK